MPAYSPMRAMGLNKPVESFYGDDDPLGWVPERQYRAGNNMAEPLQSVYFTNPLAEQRRAALYDAKKAQVEAIPQMAQLQTLNNEIAAKTGLQRLREIGMQNELQDQLQRGTLDPYSKDIGRYVAMNALSPATLNALRRSSPRGEDIENATSSILNIMPEDDTAAEQLQKVLAGSAPHVHADKDFQREVNVLRRGISASQARGNEAMLNRALNSGMDIDAMSPYLEHSNYGTRIKDRAGFMKAMSDHLNLQRASSDVMKLWNKPLTELQQQMITRASQVPDESSLQDVLAPLNPGRDFHKNPLLPAERLKAKLLWQQKPELDYKSTLNVVNKMIQDRLGKKPQGTKSALDEQMASEFE